MDDRRSEPRQRIFKAGTIEFGGAGIDCTVRNISATGAALEVASPIGIPHEITLNVPTWQLCRHSYVVWRREKKIGVVRLSAMSEAEIHAYVIADNKLAENAGWDRNLLGLEFQYLSSLDIDFDASLTGFELPEIDLLIGELDVANNNDPADAEIPLPIGPAVTRLGDIWQIGTHRLICGDSTQRDTYQQLLGEARAQLVFTDPPYNVPIAGHVGGLGSVQHREFAMA